MKDILKFVAWPFCAILAFIIIVQLAFLIVGPDYKKGEYTMVYKVYYSNSPKTYTITNEYPIDVRSNRGTNRVEKAIANPLFKNMYSGTVVMETSAPIEVVSYTFKEK
jgi:hypothetical protein